MAGAEPSAGDGDDDALDLQAGHALGRVDRGADRALGLLHVDDDAALEAPGALMADAEDAAAMREAAALRGVGLEPGDDAGDFVVPRSSAASTVLRRADGGRIFGVMP